MYLSEMCSPDALDRDFRARSAQAVRAAVENNYSRGLALLAEGNRCAHWHAERARGVRIDRVAAYLDLCAAYRATIEFYALYFNPCPGCLPALPAGAVTVHLTRAEAAVAAEQLTHAYIELCGWPKAVNPVQGHILQSVLEKLGFAVGWGP
jgi:hypothetical protein